MSSYEKVNEYIEKNPGISASAACRKVGFAPANFYSKRSKDVEKGLNVPFLKSSAAVSAGAKKRSGSKLLPATVAKRPYTKSQPVYTVVSEPVRSTSRLMVIIGTNAIEVADLVRSLQ